MLLVLLACVRLQEGDYFVDYSDVTEDSCDLYGGGQATEDATGELSWEDATLVFEFDGTDDELEFEVEGRTFTRASSGEMWLNDACWLEAERTDVGEMVSNTVFEGSTEIVAVLQGDCGVFDAMIDDPCEAAFDWRGELDE